MTTPDAIDKLRRDNAYLLARNAQLQDDVIALTAEAQRLAQIVERTHARRSATAPNPLGSGQ
jgi:hypothetical protein